MNLSQDQEQAYALIAKWLKGYLAKPAGILHHPDHSKKSFVLAGYAGTGKSTLISSLKMLLIKDKIVKDTFRIAYCSYTGKAALVLKNYLGNVGALAKKDSVSTIHSLIYSPLMNARKEIIAWERKEKLYADLIVVDEASMVDKKIWEDLLSYEKPILAVGDHGQLPPIGAEEFNLLKKPDFKLERILRQAEGNPIIELSVQARNTGAVTPGRYGKGIEVINRSAEDANEHIMDLLESYNDQTMILCGYNKTRNKLNKHIRAGREIFSEDPVPGDRVVCLKNNYQKGIFNGMLGIAKTIEVLDEDKLYAEIEFDGYAKDSINLYRGEISRKQFAADQKVLAKLDLFDFGYALTVHKAQGSQMERVILFAEKFPRSTEADWRKWLYTGITRAQESLYLIV
jgi:exodeoxyribonuclease-5